MRMVVLRQYRAATVNLSQSKSLQCVQYIFCISYLNMAANDFKIRIRQRGGIQFTGHMVSLCCGRCFQPKEKFIRILE